MAGTRRFQQGEEWGEEDRDHRGHAACRGRVVYRGAAADIQRYLTVLLVETRNAVARAIPIDQAVATVAQSERGKWKPFDAYNGRNVTVAYQQLERE